ncbi:acyl-CoA thioesterase [Bacilliculturomica massiliensis]|uniref:acyl-CoA thioesterase n=1 Tax=Bacilliculturomica massiliensis TaxID=1917867 RepID=UPI00102F353D|nr:thioesterase family protein [Bacilliculturomica massiliensis]
MIEWRNDIRVPYADTDAMGVVYHMNYIKYFEVGRGEMMRGLGFPYREMEKEGMMLPVIECACKYKTPAVYDDVLEIRSILTEVKSASIRVDYEIRRKEDGVLLVTGMTRHAVTDKSMKPVRLKTHFPAFYASMTGETEAEDTEKNRNGR